MIAAVALALVLSSTALEEARTALDADDWPAALAQAEALTRQSPDDPETRALLGEALLRAGELERAAEVLAPFANPEGAPVRGWVALARLRSAEGRDDLAAELYARALAAAPDDPHVLYWASGSLPTRAEVIAALERFLAVGAAQDPDRLEGARGSIRLYRALGDKPVWVLEERPANGAFKLDRSFRGGDLVNISVPIALGTKRSRFEVLLDTGSPGLFLAHDAARRRGLRELSEEVVFAAGGSGRHTSHRGTLDRLEVGGVRYRDVLVTTSEDAFHPSLRARGVLGLSAFEGYRVTLDLGAGEVTLEQPPAEPEPGGAPYWTVAGQMLVRAGVPSGASGLFLLDTGASRTLLHRGFVERIPGAKVRGDARVQTYGGARDDAIEVGGVVVQFQGAQLGGRALHASDLSMRSRLGGVEVSGFLGLDFLTARTIVIDTRHRRVWLN